MFSSSLALIGIEEQMRKNKAILIVGVGGLGSQPLSRSHGAAHRATSAWSIPIRSRSPTSIGRSSIRGAILRPRSRPPPVICAKSTGLTIEKFPIALDADNAREIVERFDFVIDGTDSPAAKFLINDVAIATSTPFVYGGVLGMSGQAMTVIPGHTACIRCLFEDAPDPSEVASCREAGILGPVAGMIGNLQAFEALSVVAGRKAGSREESSPTTSGTRARPLHQGKSATAMRLRRIRARNIEHAPAHQAGRRNAMSYITNLKCRECGQEYPISPLHVCETCFGPLEITYDYARIRAAISRKLIESRPHNLWRYRELLPVDSEPEAGPFSGFTPLVHAKRLGAELGIKNLYIKDDTVNHPTLSYKDRVVSVAITRRASSASPPFHALRPGISRPRWRRTRLARI